jgi:hypothetical protein
VIGSGQWNVFRKFLLCGLSFIAAGHWVVKDSDSTAKGAKSQNGHMPIIYICDLELGGSEK